MYTYDRNSARGRSRPLRRETGENNTSARIDRGTISQCRQRSAGAKWQAVEDQRGEDQRDRATSRRRLKILGTGLKLSHIKTYRAHLDRGSGGQQSEIALPPCEHSNWPLRYCEERRRSIQCRTRQPEVHREAWKHPALVSSLARSGCPFRVGDRASLGCRRAGSPFLAGVARDCGSRRAAFAGA